VKVGVSGFLARELARLGEAIREAETDGTPYEIDELKPSAKHAPNLRIAAS